MKLTKKQEIFCSAYETHGKFSEAKAASVFQHPCEYGSRFYVYFLINPINDMIFYVGKGKDKRAENHMRENRTGRMVNSRKHAIINEIIAAGEKPQIIVFCNNLQEKQAYALERILIKRFRETITNASSGSYDKHEGTRQWAIATLRKAVPFDLWIRRRERTPEEVEIYKDILSTLEQVASGDLKLFDTIKISNRNGFNCIEIS